MIKLLRDGSAIRDFLPIMGQKGYISAKSDDYGWFKNEEFAIAFVIDKRAVFKRLIFMSEVVSLRGKEFSANEEKSFLEEVIEFIKEKNLVDFIYKAHANVIFKSCPDGAVCVPWGTFVVDINCSSEELLKSFKSKERQKIRRAIKDGVEIKGSKDVELIYNIIKNTMQRQKSINYPSLNYLQTLQKNLGSSVKFFVAKLNGEVQGCEVVVFDKKRAYVPYAGSIAKPHLGAIHLMHYEAMKQMQKLGVKEYDFVGTRLYDLEGSKFSGINRFKRGFNPKVEKGYAFRYSINPIKYKLFNLLSKTYLALKGYRYIDPIEQIKSDMNLKEAKIWQE